MSELALLPGGETPSAPSGLKGRQRVAALLIALGPEKAGEVLKHLSDAEVQALSAEMANMRKIPAEQTAAVLDELVMTVSSDEQAALAAWTSRAPRWRPRWASSAPTRCSSSSPRATERAHSPSCARRRPTRSSPSSPRSRRR